MSFKYIDQEGAYHKCNKHSYQYYDNAERALWFMEKHVTRSRCQIEWCTIHCAYHIVPVKSHE